MAYKSLEAALLDLERHGHLKRIETELSPDLEIAEVHRRVFEAGGPALWFRRVQGSPFTAASNLYGTRERIRFLFRHSLERVQRIIELKADPTRFLKNWKRYLASPFVALTGLPKRVRWGAKPVLYGRTGIEQLPQIRAWPMDGGAFVTLPQVLSLPPGSRSIMQSNLGMYRIQLSGNQYRTGEEIGLHYQLHRGIGVHHSQYNNSDQPFRISVFVGGPPSHAFAAIMPLPEGLSELTFAGLLNGRRFRYAWQGEHVLSCDADFCIVGTVEKDRKLPEGPFGDHLGYYSLQHDFPVMRVEAVYHRRNPVWHFTVVGRPPAEDSGFGYLIHELVRELTPVEFPGLRSVHAVDAAGVHPLLLAVGSERYMPFRERRPEEILTIANRLLGSGQTSLAKYLIIAAGEDNPALDAHHTPDFFRHVLERVDWQRDLHFHTQTTIDTLDYSGTGWNAGSKLVVACCGPQRRSLGAELPPGFGLPEGFSAPHFALPGILCLQAPPFEDYPTAGRQIDRLIDQLRHCDWSHCPLIVLCDDSAFAAATLNNFLWVTFTRSNPSHDIYGIDSFVEYKHWGCRSALLIDARIKSHHAPTLEVDKKTKERVDKLFAKGGALQGIA